MRGGQTGANLVQRRLAVHGLNAADPSAPSSVASLKAVDAMAFPAPGKAVEPAAPNTGLQINFTPEMARELLAYMRAEHAAGPLAAKWPEGSSSEGLARRE